MTHLYNTIDTNNIENVYSSITDIDQIDCIYTDIDTTNIEDVYSSITDIDQNVDCPIFQEETML